MDIGDEEVKKVVLSKNFKKFVIWAKGWANALYYFSLLLKEIESGKVYNEKQISKKLIELKIPSALKRSKITIDDCKNFQLYYGAWAYDHNLPVPRKMNGNRAVKIKALLRNYEMRDIEQALDKASKSDFIQSNNFFTIDWVTNLGNFSKLIEGNYDNKKKGLLGDF